MKNQRRNRRHFKLKASPGAYSARHGPGPARPTDAMPGSPADASEPWRKDWPTFGLPTVTLLPGGAVVRRRP